MKYIVVICMWLAALTGAMAADTKAEGTSLPNTLIPSARRRRERP